MDFRELLKEAQDKISPLRVGVEDVMASRLEINASNQIILKVGRKVSVAEREYLKLKGFNNDGDIWWKMNDGSAEEIRGVFNIASGDSLQEKIDETEKVIKIQERLKLKQSANEIFADFSRDAAENTVLEMYLASESSDRQRAQERVLSYALGKPVERNMNMNINISNMDQNELISNIHESIGRIGHKIGIEGRIRDTTSFLIEDRDDGGKGEA